MQQQRQDNEVIHHADDGHYEVEWLQRVKPQNEDDGQQPDRTVRMPERKPQ